MPAQLMPAQLMPAQLMPAQLGPAQLMPAADEVVVAVVVVMSGYLFRELWSA